MHYFINEMSDLVILLADILNQRAVVNEINLLLVVVVILTLKEDGQLFWILRVQEWEELGFFPLLSFTTLDQKPLRIFI
jgi:hypothetical protein